MKLDDLRNILLSERETGRLTSVSPDLFERGHAELTALTERVYDCDDPLSDEARALIEETVAIRETLHDLFVIRFRKILALTVMQAEGNYYDREEVRRMIPTEKEMFDAITAGISRCQDTLLHTAYSMQPVPAGYDEEEGEPGTSPPEDAGPGHMPPAHTKNPPPLAPPCVLVRVLEDMDSFMGVDGRIYTLSKGDIVTLPERNAAVLSERNIVLNINLCK